MRRMMGMALLASSLACPTIAEPFTQPQRDEIVRIVREALKRDPSILREAVEALQADEGRQQRESSRAAIASLHGALIEPADPVAGNPAGDVTIVEFFDVRCPYCRRLEPTMAELLGGDRGIRLVYKDLPVLGPGSQLGAKVLLAAQRQGGYEKLRDAMMGASATSNITSETIRADVQRLGLDWPRIEHDMSDPAIQSRLDGNIRLSRELGIQGTPALIVGQDLIPGAAELPELQKAVAAARAERR
jgi:protein-disulfide isomerase